MPLALRLIFASVSRAMLVTTTLVSLACAGLMGQPVTFEGSWHNTTFDSTGSSSFTVSVDGGLVFLVFDLGGTVFGVQDPSPVTIQGEVTATGLVFRQDDDPFFGDILITIALDGSFRMEFNNVPQPGIDQQVSTGVLTANGLTTDYEVFFSGDGSAVGTGGVDLTQGSLPVKNYFAQYGNGGDFMSDVVASNPTDQPVNAFVLLADGNGQPLNGGLSVLSADGRVLQTISPQGMSSSAINFQIPPRDSVTLRSDGQGPISVGSAVIVSAVDVGGVVRFSFPGSGIAGVGESELFHSCIVPVRRLEGDIDTGIAIYNPNNQPLDVDVTLRSEGQDVATGTIEGIAAFGHGAQFISQLFPDVDTSNFSGSLILEASDGLEIATVAIEMGNDPGEFTTLPVTGIN